MKITEILRNLAKKRRKSRDDYIQKTIENSRKRYEFYNKFKAIPRGLSRENHRKIIEIL